MKIYKKLKKESRSHILLIHLFIFLLFMISCQNQRSSSDNPSSEISRYSGPIIDMHLHASKLEDFGGGVSICTNRDKLIFTGWDPQQDINFKTLVTCANPIPASKTDSALMYESISMLERYDIYAVTMGTLDLVNQWVEASPTRMIPALSFTSTSSKNFSTDDFIEFYRSGKMQVFAENGAQYHGRRLDDVGYDPFFALAEEFDIPVGVHLGEGPPGGAHLIGGSTPSPYRAALTSPFQLESVLIKYPKLRIYVMHFGSPLIDEMIAMLYSHPQLYVDIAQNNWGFPKDHFYSQLKRLIDAGFEERIMWGSDQLAWPETIKIAIETIQEAPFLSLKQKSDILYNNAARFMRLSNEEIARHHDS